MRRWETTTATTSKWACACVEVVPHVDNVRRAQDAPHSLNGALAEQFSWCVDSFHSYDPQASEFMSSKELRPRRRIVATRKMAPRVCACACSCPLCRIHGTTRRRSQDHHPEHRHVYVSLCRLFCDIHGLKLILLLHRVQVRLFDTRALLPYYVLRSWSERTGSTILT